MWSLAAFTRLFAHLTGPSGPRPETTIALKHLVAPHVLLGRDWLERRARSSARFPTDVSPDQHARFEQAVRGHAQFEDPG